MNVHWTNTAIEHLLAIYDYIARDSPMYVEQPLTGSPDAVILSKNFLERTGAFLNMIDPAAQAKYGKAVIPVDDVFEGLSQITGR